MRVSVAVPMVQVRVVGMPVNHRGVPVPMGVWLAGIDVRRVLVLVVLVVAVLMLVLQRLVCVLVLVSLRQVQP